MDKYNPIGTEATPYFGWYVKYPDDNEIQTAYQLLVATDPVALNSGKGLVWNSGKIASTMQNYVYLQGKALLPATRYYWTVRTWDKDGNMSTYAKPQYFDTGLQKSADWAGSKWIKRENKDADDYTYYRKSAAIAGKPIKRAIIYISAAHNYELYMNGQLVGKGSMNHYPQHQYYQAFDVTNLIHPAQKNLIATLVHWYGGGQGRAPNARGLLVKAIVEHTDGSQEVIGSDRTWKEQQATYWHTGQPRRNGEGNGYIDLIDSRNEDASWNLPTYNDDNWPLATEIGAPPTSPWVNDLQPDLRRVIEQEITPVKITRVGKKQVIDLGKIYAGVPVIEFKGGAAGDTVNLLGGFVLNGDGTVSTKINQQTNMSYRVVLNGGISKFKPMVYLGMRYIEVENSPCELTTANVRFIMRHFELDSSRSTFDSSDEMLNEVWELMKYSLLAGAQEDFVDTPTREKGAFLGDGWSEAVPSLSVMGDRLMNERALDQFLQSQDQYWPDGRLNSVYPNVDGKRDIPDYTQSYLVWVWDYYLQTGNRKFLVDNYVRLKKIADYVARYRDEKTGLVTNLAGGSGGYLYGIIDWPKQMRYGYDMNAAARTVINAYAYIDFKTLSMIAGETGHQEDHLTFDKMASGIADAMNSKLINKDGVYHDGLLPDLSASPHVSQHANMYPLAMGIVPAANRKAVIDEVKKQKMSVGMVTLRYLPEAIGQADEGAHLIKLYTNTDWDGWAKNITQGATITWESWDADKENESMSHPWGAVGLLGIEEYILGVKVLKPQHELIQIKPLEFNNALHAAKGKLPTDKGDIDISWKREAKTYTLLLTIPINMHANVYIPKSGTTGNKLIVDGKQITASEDGKYLYVEHIGSGRHSFERAAN